MSEKESKRIVDFLSSTGFDFNVLEHAPVYTSEEAAKVRNQPLDIGVKSIVLRTSENAFLLACVSGDKRIDLARLAAFLEVKNVSLASPKEVLEQTGCEIGSVGPFGNIFGLKTFFDKRILEHKFVEFNVGLHTVSVRMNPRDLARVVKPEIADFAKA